MGITWFNKWFNGTFQSMRKAVQNTAISSFKLIRLIKQRRNKEIWSSSARQCVWMCHGKLSQGKGWDSQSQEMDSFLEFLTYPRSSKKSSSEFRKTPKSWGNAIDSGRETTNSKPLASCSNQRQFNDHHNVMEIQWMNPTMNEARQVTSRCDHTACLIIQLSGCTDYSSEWNPQFQPVICRLMLSDGYDRMSWETNVRTPWLTDDSVTRIYWNSILSATHARRITTLRRTGI